MKKHKSAKAKLPFLAQVCKLIPIHLTAKLTTRYGIDSRPAPSPLGATSAIRYNPLCKNFAARLAAQGKSPIVIVEAIMTKLLHIIYGVLKHGRPFFNPYHAT